MRFRADGYADIRGLTVRGRIYRQFFVFTDGLKLYLESRARITNVILSHNVI
jgi:hypothetical protein